MMCRKWAKIFFFLLFVSLSCSAQSGALTHTVKKGETLYAIARIYQTTVAELRAKNPSSEHGISVGQTLYIPQNTLSNEQSRYHTIKVGETLFRLTQLYGTTVQDLCDANPGLSAENFKIGQTIVIPPMESSFVDDTPQRVDALTTTPKCREIHKVVRKETIYSIARMYGVSEAELITANAELANPAHKLRKGDFLCIPYPIKQNEETELSFPQEPVIEQPERIKVAVILPLEQGSESLRMIEFYRGFLMAVDSLKNGGVSIDVIALESGSSVADMQIVVSNPALEGVNMIFGPLHAEQTAVLSQFARTQQAKLIVPFSNRSNEVFNSPNIYLVNAPRNYQFGEVKEHFYNSFSNYNIILLDTFEGDTDKMNFSEELRSFLTEKGVEYKSISIKSTDEQLRKSFSTMQRNMIVPNSSTLSALNALMRRLKEFKSYNQHYAVSLFGYPEWQTYATNHAENFHEMDTYIYSSFYAPLNYWRTNLFERKFRANFGSEILATFPRFAMLGFDVGYYFMKSFSTYGHTFEQHTKTIQVSPLQNAMEYKRVSNWGGFINRKMNFVHYRTNQPVEVIEF